MRGPMAMGKRVKCQLWIQKEILMGQILPAPQYLIVIGIKMEGPTNQEHELVGPHPK